MRILIRLVAVALAGLATAVLVSCGSSGKGLIPAASAGPLQSDFVAVAQAAASGNGSCATTESALGKTEQDFLALPANVDVGLHARLEQGISNLRKLALGMCIQPAVPTATSTTGTPTVTTTTPTTTTTNTQTTLTPSTPSTTPTTPTNPQTTPSTTAPNQSGGTEASGEGSGEASPGAAQEGADNGASNSGGASPGNGQ